MTYQPGRSITRARQLRVIQRDHATCQCCGFMAHTSYAANLIEVDHIVPVAHGGSNDMENLQVLCSRCNNLKGTRSYEWLLNTFWGRMGEIHASEIRIYGHSITKAYDQSWR